MIQWPDVTTMAEHVIGLELKHRPLAVRELPQVLRPNDFTDLTARAVFVAAQRYVDEVGDRATADGFAGRLSTLGLAARANRFMAVDVPNFVGHVHGGIVLQASVRRLVEDAAMVVEATGGSSDAVVKEMLDARADMVSTRAARFGPKRNPAAQESRVQEAEGTFRAAVAAAGKPVALEATVRELYEGTVVQACLKDPSLLDTLPFTPEHFKTSEYRTALEVMQGLGSRLVDPVTLAWELKCQAEAERTYNATQPEQNRRSLDDVGHLDMTTIMHMYDGHVTAEHLRTAVVGLAEDVIRQDRTEKAASMRAHAWRAGQPPGAMLEVVSAEVHNAMENTSRLRAKISGDSTGVVARAAAGR